MLPSRSHGTGASYPDRWRSPRTAISAAFGTASFRSCIRLALSWMDSSVSSRHVRAGVGEARESSRPELLAVCRLQRAARRPKPQCRQQDHEPEHQRVHSENQGDTIRARAGQAQDKKRQED